MADKEATVYVVDVGKSMGCKNYGRHESDLDWGMKYVWDRIATTVSTGRKTLCVGVVAFRTYETQNDLAGEDAFENISVLKPISQILMQDVRDLRAKIKPSVTDSGDAISALVIAIQMIITFCKKLKYLRRIVLVTNGTGYMDVDGISDIVSKLQEDSIELIILGADFDDEDYGFKEQNKLPNKAKNEGVLRSLASECNGVCGTLKQAVDELGEPRVKSVRPTPSYKGGLTLGDTSQYETALHIDVERYPKIKINRPPTSSNFVIKSNLATQDSAGESSATQTNDAVAADVEDAGLSSVKFARTYQVKDETATGGKRDVDRDNLAKGYAYGRTAVPITESDEIITKLETKASLEFVGFIPRENYDHYMSLSESNMVIGQRMNEKAIMALSSVIHALYELDSLAVGRLVTKDNKGPVFVLLSPLIEPEFECLVDVELPFAEDVRSYKFPPLDRIVTVSGKVLSDHRYLPSKELKLAMDEFVDSMDLSTFGKNDEGHSAEYMPMEETYSPVLHRLNQAIRFRAVNPSDELPPPYEIVTKFMNPPQELLDRISPYLEKVKASADIKKVPPKTLSRKRFRGEGQRDQPRSGLDVSALLSDRASINKGRISPDNAIPEFKQALDFGEDIDTVKDAVEQLGDIVASWIKESFADSNYGRAIEASRVMRESCVEMEEPGFYNEFVKSLKQKIFDDALGGDRRDLWRSLRGNKLGLIDNKLSPQSQVSEEEANEHPALSTAASAKPVSGDESWLFRSHGQPAQHAIARDVTI